MPIVGDPDAMQVENAAGAGVRIITLRTQKFKETRKITILSFSKRIVF